MQTPLSLYHLIHPGRLSPRPHVAFAVHGVWLGLLLPSLTGLPASVTEPAQARPPGSTFLVQRGQVALPDDGLWEIRHVAGTTVRQVHLTPPAQRLTQRLGQRSTAALQEERVNQGHWHVRMIYEACLEYARAHDGTGPSAFADLDPREHRYLLERLDTPPWWNWDADLEGEPPAGPFVFLVPRARFHFAEVNDRYVRPEQRELLALELRPYVDDGRHWVLYTDGSAVREPVRSDRLDPFQIEVRPILARASDPTEAAAATLLYTLHVVREGDRTGAFEVHLHNPVTGAETVVPWPAAPVREDPAVLDSLRDARRDAWQPYLRTGPAPVLRTWLAPADPLTTPATRAPDDNLSLFAILGGRTAIEETLQLQNLAPRPSTAAATIPVASLTGVTVHSHPFTEMLNGQPGGQLDLANAAPPDRFFLHVAQPTAILPFLDRGAGFLASLGAGLSGNRLDYDLTRRYLERLGMTRAVLETALRSGLIQDLALILPDLFLIDGTDLTVIVRLKQPELAGALWTVLGARDPAGAVRPMPTRDGRPAWWILEGNLLCLSTHRAELDRVLELIRHQGEGSLGQSDEFRYMLTQVPVHERTRFFAYFSDPFVRRLVGPEVKLGQMRRLEARALLEILTARALLARLDGIPSPHTVEGLIEAGYLPAAFPVNGLRLHEGVAFSSSYGQLGKLRTLLETPVDLVTPAEAGAYERYVENYSRFWSQFFDPIAIRLDDTDGALELTTFILPLIDNSIYNGLRETLLRLEDRHPLDLPVVEPTPVLQFSMNLQNAVWQSVAGGLGGLFREYGGVSPALLDDLGPAVHLAVFDADPIIALGSGDVLGAFGGTLGQRGGFGRSDMVMIPVALSVLTRPCTLRVETRDPERTARYLRQAATTGRRGRAPDDFVDITFHQVEDRDAWVWSLAFGGMVKLRVGLEVADRHLVLRNLPWATPDRLVRLEPSPMNGAGLSVWPAACDLQLPGLFASAADQERRATLAGLGRLQPLIACGLATPETAADQHDLLFGFRPLPMPDDRWVWRNHQLVSTRYGSAQHPRQPAHHADRPFGLLQTLEHLHLTMQFEDAGLRSVLRWTLRP